MAEGRRPRVLDVGQCDLDHGNIGRMLGVAFSAEVERAGTIDEAIQSATSRRFDLVLVNRILDRSSEEGVELIRRLRAAETGQRTPVMLVSNFEEAQNAAVAAGAVPGFGKSALGDPKTVKLLSVYLNNRAQPARAIQYRDR